MKKNSLLIALLLAIGVLLLMFVIVSLFDIVLAILNTRFYSTAAFITIFGVGGVFAGVFAYSKAIAYTTHKNEKNRWAIISIIILTGLLFFFPLAKLEGGEYKAAFKSYGLMLALTTIIFMRGKIE